MPLFNILFFTNSFLQHSPKYCLLLFGFWDYYGKRTIENAEVPHISLWTMEAKFYCIAISSNSKNEKGVSWEYTPCI